MSLAKSPARRASALLLTLALALALLPSFDAASSARAQESSAADIVISQVYGGGGNSGAPYTHDFVELFNRGDAPVSLAGMSIQYASATGSGDFGASPTQLTVLLDATLQPGEYYLVQQAAGAGNGVPLPTPDLIDAQPIAMAAGSGKVALVDGATSLGCNGSTEQPCSPEQLARIIDLVGYGNANFFEGSGAAPTLSNTTAGFRADGGCTDTDDNAADFASAAPAPRTTASPLNPCGEAPTGAPVTISQVYGGGGNSGATYTHDFIELYNRSSDSVSLAGWSVQYASATGSTWQTTTLSGTLEPDTHYLVQQAAGAGGTEPLPTPDAVGNIAMSATNGKVALVSSTTALSGTCPDQPNIVDLVGFGGSASCYEGSGPTPALSNTTAALRLEDGAQDTDDNASDFEVGPPMPRNSGGTAGPDPDPDPDVCVADTYINEINAVGANGLPNVTSGMFGATVSVEAVVTANYLAGLDGVFIQEEDDDADEDPATSEGIFVYLPAAADDALAEGDLICATGRIGAFQGTYQLTNVEYEIVETGVELPTAVDLVMPVDDRSELAQLAGMRVALTSETGEMTITQNFFLGRFGELDLSAAGFLWHPAELFNPESAAALQLRQDNLNAQIKLDDANSAQNPTPTPWLDNGDVRAGAVTTDTIEGITHYQFGSYRVQPTDPDAITFVNTDNPRPDGPPDVLAEVDESDITATVAAFNVLNYFTTLGSRGADTAEEFELQAAKIVTAITEMDADVVGLIEIENNFGGDNDALLDLVDRLNAVAGLGTYAAIELKEPVGTDEISNAMIYQPERVQPTGEVGIADHAEFVNPLGGSSDRNRPAIAQAFEVESGDVFVAVVNHLKSKGSSCSADGDPDDDIVGSCNLTRTAAAEELVRWLEEDDPTATGSDRIAIIGDLNAYAMEDPIDALRLGGYVDAFDDAPVYTYTFDGEHGRLDHAFVTTSLDEHVVDAAVWHINTDEPAAFDYNDWNNPEDQDTTEFRSSDHDPVLVGLAFTVAEERPGRGPSCELLPPQAREKNPRCNDGDRPQPGKPFVLWR